MAKELKMNTPCWHNEETWRCIVTVQIVHQQKYIRVTIAHSLTLSQSLAMDYRLKCRSSVLPKSTMAYQAVCACPVIKSPRIWSVLHIPAQRSTCDR